MCPVLVKQNSFKAWALAIRPKTLAAAVAPVMVGCAIAFYYHSFSIIPAIACLMFAISMQIAANLINDLYDYLKGSDKEDRLGPPRATAQGWITQNCMKKGIAVVIAMGCLFGSTLIYYAGWQMILVGCFCVVFAYFYTSGPFPLAYNGLGDVAVILFFGIVAVGFTAYVQIHMWTSVLTWGGIATGMVINTLLVLNNYRDRETDKLSGKRTLIVLLGESFGRYLYLFLGLFGVIISVTVLYAEEAFTAEGDSLIFIWCCQFVFPLIYLLLHLRTWKKICFIKSGILLNEFIGETSRNMLIFSLLFSAELVLSCID